jgi:long-subunit acyl-CoA synthetase (AMP-forming)
LFTAPKIGRQDVGELLDDLGPSPWAYGKSEKLEKVVMLRGSRKGYTTYEELKTQGKDIGDWFLDRARSAVHPDDVCNLQYTSGSTGHPKAAMLTHL